MKQTNTIPNSNANTICVNTQSHMIDEFWEDCIPTKKENQKPPKKKKNPIMLKILNNFYNKHPDIYKEEVVNEKKEKEKRKNAELRCHNLYAYGLQQQNYLKSVYNENQSQKMKSEIEKCTWKPKINKISKKTEKKIKSIGNTIYQRDQTRLIKNKQKLFRRTSVDNNNDNSLDSSFGKDILFHPRVNSNPNLNRMFNRTLLSNRENAEFIMRYAKAREEHLSKRDKIIYSKDNSMNFSITSDRRHLRSAKGSKGKYKQSLHKSLYSINFDEDNDSIENI